MEGKIFQNDGGKEVCGRHSLAKVTKICGGQMFVVLKRYCENKKLFQLPALTTVCCDVSVKAAGSGAVNGAREGGMREGRSGGWV